MTASLAELKYCCAEPIDVLLVSTACNADLGSRLMSSSCRRRLVTLAWVPRLCRWHGRLPARCIGYWQQGRRDSNLRETASP